MFDFKTKAKDLPYAAKKAMITTYYSKETQFHVEYEKVLKNMYGNCQTYILQGPTEKGKDIVVKTKNASGGYDLHAYVIKLVEKLDASAKGKAAELAVQAMQSFKIPYNIEGLEEKQLTNKVFILNAGTISEGAKDNVFSIIDVSLKANTAYIDMGILIEQFEEYYPEFFFSNNFGLMIKDQIEYIENFLKQKKLMNFIKPNLKKVNQDKKELITTTRNSEDYLKSIAEAIFGKKLSYSSFSALVLKNNSEKILLTGDAGSGKSVLVFQLLLDYLNSLITKTNLTKSNLTELIMPVCLRAIEIKDLSNSQLHTKITNYYDCKDANTPNLIILDGIDEVEKNVRDTLIETIEAYCVLHKDNKINILLTSRHNYSVIEELENYSRYELVPYEMSQAIDFIRKSAQNDNAKLAILEARLKELNGQIPFYPLALQLFIEVVKQNQEVPASITELYTRYIAMSFGEYTQEIEIDKLFEPQIKKLFFSELSYFLFFKNNKTSIEFAELDNFLLDFISKHSYISSSEEFKNSIMRTSMLKLDANVVEFSHKSFLDYFIALYFIDNRDELVEEGNFAILYREFAFDGIWEDVAYFFFGIKGKMTNRELTHFTTLIREGTSELSKYINSFFLGKLAQYAWKTESEIKTLLLQEGISNTMAAKQAFNDAFQKSLGIKVPPLFGGINMLYLINDCHASLFLRSEVKNLIDKICLKTEDNPPTDDEVAYALFYILKDSKLLGKDYMKIAIPKLITHLENMSSVKNKTFISLILELHQKKARPLTDQATIDFINNAVEKIKKRYPDEIQSLISRKHDSFRQLKRKFK